jgi:hypothetical protein
MFRNVRKFSEKRFSGGIAQDEAGDAVEDGDGCAYAADRFYERRPLTWHNGALPSGPSWDIEGQFLAIASLKIQ